jgi:hypothetical protein
VDARPLIQAWVTAQLSAPIEPFEDPFADEPPVHINHGGLEHGKNVIRGLCGARPNGRDRFIWFDPEDPVRRDVYGDPLPPEEQGVPKTVTCPRCLRIAEKVMKYGVVLEYAQREER